MRVSEQVVAHEVSTKMQEVLLHTPSGHVSFKDQLTAAGVNGEVPIDTLSCLIAEAEKRIPQDHRARKSYVDRLRCELRTVATVEQIIQLARDDAIDWLLDPD